MGTDNVNIVVNNTRLMINAIWDSPVYDNEAGVLDNISYSINLVSIINQEEVEIVVVIMKIG